MTTFYTTLIGIICHYKNANNGIFSQVIVAHVITNKKSRYFYNEYIKIKEAFKIGKIVLMIFKHIIAIPKYNRFSKTDVLIIDTLVIDNENSIIYVCIYI